MSRSGYVTMVINVYQKKTTNSYSLSLLGPIYNNIIIITITITIIITIIIICTNVLICSK